ncbi:hypothetical protein HY522_11600, partial [bacterium]|nr:hypothetical protein [bacterium]
ALEIAATSSLQLFEDASYTDDVDTFLTRDAMYVQVVDTDENRNPQFSDTVRMTVYVGNGPQGVSGGAFGLVIDTETLVLTEFGETTGVFRSGAVILTDTKVPAVNDGLVSWGRSDTLHVVYTDATGTSETAYDTALAVVIQTTAVIQLYEDANFTDDVDTYSVRNDIVYIQVIDTDENRNPQSEDTVAVTLYVGDNATGLVIDTETLLLTEESETSGIFRSAAIAVVDSDAAALAENGRIGVGANDTLHVAYTDPDNGADATFDTALIVDLATAGSMAFYEDAGYTDDADTFLVRDALYIQVTDIDENRNGGVIETVAVTLYAGNGGVGSGGAQGLVIDTERVTLTESGVSSGIFQSGAVILTDTRFPSVNDGFVSWGVSDTIHGHYVDANDPTDTSIDTALAIEILSTAVVAFYQVDYSAATDTFRVRLDAAYIEVIDTDENRNPQTKDTVVVTIWVGNRGTGSLGQVIDREDSWILTETGETTGIFRGPAILLLDTVAGTVNDLRLQAGLDDTLHIQYRDPSTPTDDVFDTALVLDGPTASSIQFYDTEHYAAVTDTYAVHDDFIYVQVIDVDENRDPNLVDTLVVEVTTWNQNGDAQVYYVDTIYLLLRETGFRTGTFRSDTRAYATNWRDSDLTDTYILTGLSDSIQALYEDDNSASSDRAVDTALMVDVPAAGTVKIYEDAAYSDDVDTFEVRDVMYIEVGDTDENRNPQRKDTVTVTVYASNGVGEGASARGLVIDTDILTLTETTDTSALFRSGAVIVTDTKVPSTTDGIVSWGRGDTLSAVYSDPNQAGDVVIDTALALEIASTSSLQLFEDASYTDDVDTYSVLNDVMYIQVIDTDENRNPQSADTISVTAHAGNGEDGLVLDTETLILTESGIATWTFRSGAITLTNTSLLVGNGVINWGAGDTLHVVYTDVTGTSETVQDTALAIDVKTDANVQFFQDTAYSDDVDTYPTRSALYLEVADTDENRGPGVTETVTVTVYAADNGAGVVLDTETLTLTESSASSGLFRSGAVILTDTKFPAANDGIVTWGLSDTLHATYTDGNDAGDEASDTALAIGIATNAAASFYEDAGFTDASETYLPRNDVVYLEVIDTDENRSPQTVEVVQVVVDVYDDQTQSLLSSELWTLTETGETTGVFRSAAIVLVDTALSSTNDGRIQAGLSDTLLIRYSDENDASDIRRDTALIVDAPTSSVTQIFEDVNYADEVDTLVT